MLEHPRVLLAHPGTQHSHKLAQQLARQDLLREFWTGFAFINHSRSTQLMRTFLPSRWQQRIANRALTGVPGGLLRTMPMTEWRAIKQVGRGESAQRVFHRRNQIFQERIPTSSLQKASSIIGFDTSSWILAERARSLGKPFFLEQTTLHALTNDSILQEAVSRFPEWRGEHEFRLPELLSSENQEHHLATKIVVFSSFAKRTLVLNGVKAEKIIINPLGVNLRLFYPSLTPRKYEVIRFLFLGAVSLHKGAPLLLEAWKKLALDRAELWIVGSLPKHVQVPIHSFSNVKIPGRFPHTELPKLLRQCDVLVLPSYAEGFGLVLLEALASGLPIITTDVTAGPDLIQDGIEGQIIPYGNLEALCKAMISFVDAPDKLAKMSAAARLCAERYSWDDYGDRWKNILEKYA